MTTPRDLYQQFHIKRKLMTSRLAVDKFAETDLTNYIDDLINLQSTFNASDHSIEDQTKSINEGFALLANCINLSPHVALQCKSKKFLTDLVMCLKKCQPVLDDFVTSALRFLANASTLKEWTLSFMLLDIDFSSLLWSYLLPDEIVDDETRKSEIEKDRAKPLKFILRFFCSFSSHGRLFVRCLLKQDCLIGLNRVFATLNLADINLITVEKIFEFLRTLSNSRDPQIVGQLLQCEDTLMKVISGLNLPNRPELTRISFDTLKLLSHFSEVRILLARFGVVEILVDLRKRETAPWDRAGLTATTDHEVEMSETVGDKSTVPPSRKELLTIIVMFCRDAFCRVKIREGGALEQIVHEFVMAEPLSDECAFTIRCFLNFLYDHASLLSLTHYVPFMHAIIRQVDQFSIKYNCQCVHGTKDGEIVRGVVDELVTKVVGLENVPKKRNFSCLNSLDENNLGKAAKIQNYEFLEPERPFRPDSPSYIALNEAAANVNDDWWDSAPFSKMHSASASPLTSPFQSPRGGFRSPGPAWSPSYSIGTSPSSTTSDSETSFNLEDFLPTPSKPTTHVAEPLSGSEIDLNDSLLSTTASTTGIDSTDVSTTTNYCSSTKLNNVAECEVKSATCCLYTAIKIINWLSHSETFETFIAQPYIVEALLKHIEIVCHPFPHAGRAMKRLLRSSNYVEMFLDMDFYGTVQKSLRIPKCEYLNDSENDHLICNKCMVRLKIGKDLITSLQTQLDSVFGVSAVERRLTLTGSENINTRYRAACVTAHMIKNSVRRRRLVNLSLSIFRQKIDQDSISIDAQCLEDIGECILECFRGRFLNLNIICKFALQDAVQCSLDLHSVSRDETPAIYFRFEQCAATTILKMDRSVVLAQSGFFRGLLEGNFRETQFDSIAYVDIDEWSVESFSAFLHYVYGCRRCCAILQLNSEQTLQLVMIADRYLVPNMLRYVVNDIIPGRVSVETVASYMCMATCMPQCGELLWSHAFSYMILKFTKWEMVQLLQAMKDTDAGKFWNDFWLNLHRRLEHL